MSNAKATLDALRAGRFRIVKPPGISPHDEAIYDTASAIIDDLIADYTRTADDTVALMVAVMSLEKFLSKLYQEALEGTDSNGGNDAEKN
jgi:hypothetical protein